LKYLNILATGRLDELFDHTGLTQLSRRRALLRSNYDKLTMPIMARKSLGISAGLLSLAFLLGGCAISDVELWPPTPGTPTEEIYVSLDTWHAMIAIPQKNVQDLQHFSDMPSLKTLAAEQPAFEEWGYAERAWYLENRQGLSGVLRALFWPTDGVVEIAEYNQVWADRTPQHPSDLFIFRISQEGYQRLRRHLRSTIISSDPIETVRNSRFFRAARSYHLFHQCHHYAALALQEAGLPISTFWAFNRSSLALQLHRAKSLENEKIEDEPHEGVLSTLSQIGLRLSVEPGT